MPKGRQRRLDIEEILGYVPEPELEGFAYLIEILFYVGPYRNDESLREEDFDSWERRRGIELDPWEVETMVMLSSEYRKQLHLSKSMSCLCPWEYGQGVWRYVTDEKAKQDKEARDKADEKRIEKEQQPDGNRKRHRNSAPR